jgi:phosphate acyltransferase
MSTPARPTLILDTMGADLGTTEMVRGAAQACLAAGDRRFDLEIVSADEEEARRAIESELARPAAQIGCRVNLTLAEEQLPNEIASPLEAFRKYPQCSIRVAMEKAKELPHSAVISPGTTGLVMAAAVFTLGRVRGVARAPIGTPLPTRGKQLFFVDGGSNVDCTPQQLYEFAVLAHLYIKNTTGNPRPSIALLSNGSEDYKGNQKVRDAFELLRQDAELNFNGFIEGHTLFDGELDIMVCDGFIGNILLKFAEGAGGMIIGAFKDEIKKSLAAKLAARLFQSRPLQRFGDRLDYTRFGGAPLLGLNGNVIICHGRSNARAIKHALLVGYQVAQSNISAQVAQYFEEHELEERSRHADPGRRSPNPGRRPDDQVQLATSQQDQAPPN